MSEVVAVDIGGTHARFAIAEVEGVRVVSLGAETVLKTAEHSTFQRAWEAFGERARRPLPRFAGIAIACPVQGEVLKLTNNDWEIRPDEFAATLDLERFTLVNDFEAVGHAIAALGTEHFRYLCGPDQPLPEQGVISIVGPGTGLGVAQILRTADGYHIIATEGGHIDFAPLDATDDAILAHLRARHGRVSAERIVSGQGLPNIYEALGGATTDGKALWTSALAGADKMAVEALDRLCLSLGAVAGDIALAQGASGVVIAGGLGLRLADILPLSGFAQRFVAKGRFKALMAGIPVKLITTAEPGLYGAAAAFAARHQN